MVKKEDHFAVEQPHTKLKHKLFEAALKNCVSISNAFNNKNREKRQFLYMDLYAGCGQFDDKSQGSPLIALDIIKNQIEDKNNNFNKINVVTSEKDSGNAAKLKNNISNFVELNAMSGIVNSSVYDKPWEECEKEFAEYVKNAKWGFLFVDPFSVELDLGELKKLIGNNPYFKDILILINSNAHERILGRKDDESLEKISKYFDANLKLVKRLKGIDKNCNDLEIFNNTSIIQFLIKRAFQPLDKDFVINLAITRSREGQLENADRFYLCLITGSIGVANAFLTTYSELLNEKNGGQFDLFSQFAETKYFKLNEKIQKILTHKKMKLYQLISKLFNDFYSWKEALPNEIPTSVNIKNAINTLADSGQITIETESFLDKRSIKKGKKKLTSEAFNSKKNLREVEISGMFRR